MTNEQLAELAKRMAAVAGGTRVHTQIVKSDFGGDRQALSVDFDWQNTESEFGLFQFKDNRVVDLKINNPTVENWDKWSQICRLALENKGE